MISSEEYEEMIYQTYFSWCHKRASSDNTLQELLANASVNKWFLREYGKLEQNFINVIEHFPIQVMDLTYHYKGCTVEIYNLFPLDLINGLKVNPDYSFKLNNNAIIYAN